MGWIPVEQGFVNLDQAVKIVNDGNVVTVVFQRGETERIPVEKWELILGVIKPGKPEPTAKSKPRA